jgi:hypothetical protein
MARKIAAGMMPKERLSDKRQHSHTVLIAFLLAFAGATMLALS